MNILPISPNRSNLSGCIVFILTVIVLFSGCKTLDTVKSDQIHISGEETPFQMAQGDPKIVYTVSTEKMRISLEIKKFGIHYLDDTKVNVGEGLSYIIYLNDIGNRTKSELNRILSTVNLNSLDDFITAYESEKPIAPGSSFVALPDKLGYELFNLAMKTKSVDEK